MAAKKSARDSSKPSMAAVEKYVLSSITVYKDDDGWWVAQAPRMQGAISQGRTWAKAIRSLEGAVRDLLVTYQMQGRKPPVRPVTR